MIGEKLRFLWRGSVRIMSWDILLPISLVPAYLILAAQSVWCFFVVFLSLPLVLGYLYNYYITYNLHTKFFLSWAITSIVIPAYMFNTMCFLLILENEEYYAAMILLLASLCCLTKARFSAKLNAVKSYSILPTSSTESIVNLSNDSINSLTTSFNIRETICPTCCKQIPPRAYHCNICNVCVLKRNYHCVWLNCCIGSNNHRMYFFGLLLLFMCAIFVSNLILTSLCLPYKIFLTVQIPIDCSEVFIDIIYTQYFVIGSYLLLVSVYLLFLLISEIINISLGMTGHEGRLSNNGKSRSYCCFQRASVYSRGCWQNWFNFVRDKS